MAGQQLPSYDAMQQAWGQPQQGLTGLLSSPITQGLLGAGLGAMASRGNTMQAVGRGGLLGLSAYGQAQDQQQNRILQMAQAKLQQDQLDKEQQKKDQIQGMIGSIFSGSGQGGTGTTGGGLGGASIDQISALEAMGGPKLLDHWKTAQTGVAQDGGKFYTKNGQTQYMPQVDKGITFDPVTGQAIAIPGYAGANAKIQGEQTQANEAAKYPYTVGADNARQQTQAGLDVIQVTGSDGSTYYMPRSQVAGATQGGSGQGGAGPNGMPYMGSRNPVNVQTDQRLNDNWITKTYQPTLDAADGARGTLASIQAARNLDLRTGWGTEAMSKGANFLVGLGLGWEEAQKLASNSQMFGSVAMDRLLKTLQMQVGPQTEGDAARASQTWVTLQNTPQANEFILDFAEAQARQQARKAAFYEKALPIAKSNGDLTEVDRRWRQVSGSVWSDPLMQKWAPQQKPKSGGANGAF